MRMDVTQLAGVDFRNAALGKAKIDLRLDPGINRATFESAFNHRNNNGFSILRTVESIDSRYANAKVDLMQQLLAGVTQRLRHNPEIKDHFLASNISLAFGDVLLQNPLYVNGSMEIKNFVQNRLEPALLEPELLEHWNDKRLEPQDVNPLRLEKLATWLTAKLAKANQAPGFAASHRVVIGRTLTACRQEPSLVAAFDRLYDAWHGHPEIQLKQASSGRLKTE